MPETAIVLAGLALLASCASTPPVPPAAPADLAPTGKVRVNPVFAVRDARTGEASGIAVDLAHELGRRLDVPVELVGYGYGGQLTAGLKAGGWDVAFLAFEQGRTTEISFSPSFAETDATYLVEADRKGVRIAVGARGGK